MFGPLAPYLVIIGKRLLNGGILQKWEYWNHFILFQLIRKLVGKSKKPTEDTRFLKHLMPLIFMVFTVQFTCAGLFCFAHIRPATLLGRFTVFGQS